MASFVRALFDSDYRQHRRIIQDVELDIDVTKEALKKARRRLDDLSGRADSSAITRGAALHRVLFLQDHLGRLQLRLERERQRIS
jgi:hypothetical protein